MPRAHNQKVKKLRRAKKDALWYLEDMATVDESVKKEYERAKEAWIQPEKANRPFAGIGVESGARIMSVDGTVYTIQPNGSMRSDQRPHLRKKERRVQKRAMKQMMEATKQFS